MKQKCHEPIKKKFTKAPFEYVTLEEQMKATPDWPPISASTNNLAQMMRIESVASGLSLGDVNLEEEGQRSASFNGGNGDITPDSSSGIDPGNNHGPGGDWIVGSAENGSVPGSPDHTTGYPGFNQGPGDVQLDLNESIGSAHRLLIESPPNSPRDGVKLPLLEPLPEKKETPKAPPGQDPSVPLLNQVQDKSLLRTSSLDTSPLVKNEVEAQLIGNTLQSTEL